MNSDSVVVENIALRIMQRIVAADEFYGPATKCVDTVLLTKQL